MGGRFGKVGGKRSPRKLVVGCVVKILFEIFVTAYSSEVTLDRMRDLAPEGVVFKPFLEKELLDLVAKAVKPHAN
jgi:hypothetical protein